MNKLQKRFLLGLPKSTPSQSVYSTIAYQEYLGSDVARLRTVSTAKFVINDHTCDIQCMRYVFIQVSTKDLRIRPCRSRLTRSVACMYWKNSIELLPTYVQAAVVFLAKLNQ